MNTRHDIPMALRAAYRLMHRRTAGWLAELGVTADQFVLLALLEERDGVTQQELVGRAASDPNTVRAMLILLEKRGLLRRRSHPADGRAVLVTLTAMGRGACRRIAAQIGPLQDQLSGLFTAREAKMLLDFLGRISDAMQGTEAPSATPPDKACNKQGVRR